MIKSRTHSSVLLSSSVLTALAFSLDARATNDVSCTDYNGTCYYATTTSGNTAIEAYSHAGTAVSATDTYSGSGTTFGVQAASLSSDGYGVYAGGNVGVFGTSFNAQEPGVWGENDSTGGYGVYGTTSASDGVGVYGLNQSASGGTGVYGAGYSYGVYGTGTNYGIYGTSSSGPGLSAHSSGSGTAGVAGYATGSNSSGVYGECTSGTSCANAGFFRGNVIITGNLDIQGSCTGCSDIRLKKNVQVLDGSRAIDELLKLRGVTYEWKDPSAHEDDTGTVHGFVAQDVEKVFPSWVNHEGYTAPDGQKYLTLELRQIEALEVESIRILKAENDTLKAKNDSLERRVEALENSRFPVVSVLGRNGAGFGIAGLAMASAIVFVGRRRKEEERV